MKLHLFKMKTNYLMQLCFILFVTHVISVLSMNSPPLMRKQPPNNELLFTVASQSGDRQRPFILECEAEGEPTPKYHWIKNGKPFNYQSYDDRISQQPGRGTLVISSPRDEDSGQYQCFAENSLGIATSNSVFVRKAELNSFKDDDQKIYTATLGKPFKLTCDPPDGWPKPHVYWLIRSINIINDSRVTLDPEGNLYFSNITHNDASDQGYYYVCVANSVHRNEFKVSGKVFIQVSSNHISSTQNRYPPELQYVSRRNEVAYRGKTLELYCIFGGTPLPEVVWSKSGTNLKFSNRIMLDNYGRTLRIKHVTDEDKGTYTCAVSNGVGEQKTHSIEVNVLATPYFTIEPKMSNSAEGETVSFTCKAEGNPEPEIKWIFNGKPIYEAPDNPRRKVYTNEIIIKDLEARDTGNYGCNATNSLGYVYKDVYVNVLALPPEIHEAPNNETVVDEKTVRMVCRVFGAPTPEVKWFRGGTELTGGRYTVLDTGDLEIRNVTFNDAGDYNCRAVNKFGSIEAAGSLTVKRHTEIVDKPENYEVTAGTQATFRCNALYDPSLDLEIDWFANDKPINFETEPRFIKSSDFSLTISKTIELDSGTYTCEASTRYDKDRASASLIVQDVPNPPQLESVQCNKNDASIKWRPMGDNRAPITRYTIQYNTSFTPDSWEVAYESVPAIDITYNVAMSPWANYTFRIIAWNKIGSSLPSDHSSACTTEPEVPHKNPHNVKGMGTSPDNLVISWTPMPEIEHNGRGFQYRVSWKLNVPYANWTIEDIPNWRQSELLIENQSTYQEYKITVIAMNEKGVSDVAPNEVIGYSGQDVPQQAPLDFTLVNVVSATTAVVKWTNVDTNTVRGPLRGYKVQVWTDDDMVNTFEETVIVEDASRALITKLVPFTRNYARVLVFNDRYNGPPSNTITIDTPEGVPDAVQSLVAYQNGASSFYLTWKKPYRENGNLTGYKIYYQVIEGTQVGPLMERKGQVTNPLQTDAKLSGLRPNTKYRIHVKATTKAGEKETGTFVELRTANESTVPPDVPSFKLDKLPSESGFSKVLVTWLPNYQGNPGSYFFVKYRLDGEPEYMETLAETNENYMILKDLLPDQVYDIKVVSVDGNYYVESLPQQLDTYNTDGPIIQLRENVATAGWFIGMMLAIAFLLLALLFVCVMKRNRGGKYAVHEREQANGRRDYGDEGGFHEYSQPLDSKSNGRNSMNSEPKTGLESDTDSMAEYAEGDTEGMNEDGSFIGQYGTHKKGGETSHGFTTLV